MSSVLSAVSQIPRSSGLLIGIATVANNTVRFFSEAEFAAGPLASASATVAGTNVYFTTNATANSALVVASALGAGIAGSRVLSLQSFKDLGKNYMIYAPTDTAGAVQVLLAVFTKVRRIGAAADMADWEGDNGTVGYICTWSAQQTNALGVLSTQAPICAVARSGFGHAF